MSFICYFWLIVEVEYWGSTFFASTPKRGQQKIGGSILAPPACMLGKIQVTRICFQFMHSIVTIRLKLGIENNTYMNVREKSTAALLFAPKTP